MIDGDGSIQVNHWKHQSLQYRLVIKLKNDVDNYNHNMLVMIKNTIGGNVKYVSNNQFVIWVVDDKSKIKNIIKIFKIYPLLTSNKNCQLDFLKKYIYLDVTSQLTINDYLITRNQKYDNRNYYINKYNKLSLNDCNISNYFNEWLMGFIEAEGCFSIRKSKYHSFSISQKYDKYLFEWISIKFDILNQIRNPSTDFYILEVYRKNILMEIINYCDKYSFLGQKKVSYLRWKEVIN